eukprot:scaffold916_cov516-Prasinococcus_capsulatus_cf.AAC.10
MRRQHPHARPADAHSGGETVRPATRPIRSAVPPPRRRDGAGDCARGPRRSKPQDGAWPQPGGCGDAADASPR